ncbi:MAG: glutamate--tRNA ligase family protein [Chthoniobacteraceae bacterium]|nr:glutamate--tRNA ligase family protein [Chthoniobacteraceae bacterium]
MPTSPYRGRIAPSPTGFLHLGHARTFWIAQERARQAGGTLILRVEDLDTARCKPEFTAALQEDLRWFGFQWAEGPDCGGPHGPYVQSARTPLYLELLERLRVGGFVYPCRCSRRDVQLAAGAPHPGEEEPLYPGTCRPKAAGAIAPEGLTGVHWRFRVPQGERLFFTDGARGPQTALAGSDFGDFVVWRRDGVPAYQLAVVADDMAMGITEVVRGADLLLSTFRQLLIYRALGFTPPAFYHAPLLCDPATGLRLAKRHAALSLRQLRAGGAMPGVLRRGWAN